MVLVPLICPNHNSRIDPVRFPCDIGRLADALLLYDRLIVVSESMRELIGLVHWLGRSQCSRLIQSGVLRFALLQHQPAVWRRQHDGSYGIIQALQTTRHHPNPDHGWLRTQAELSHYLRSLFRDGNYLAEGWVASNDLANLIASATSILHPDLAKTAVELTGKVLADPNQVDAIATRFRSALGRPTSVAPGMRLEGANTIVIPTEDANTIGDLNSFVDCMVELCVSAALASGHLTSPAGEALLSEISRRSAPDGMADRETSFREICALEGLPRFQDVVFTGEVSAESILRLREQPDAERFRSWLSANQSPTGEGRSALQAYYRSIDKVFIRDSLPLSVLRIVGTLGISCVNPIAGVAVSVLDWLFGRLCLTPQWSPKVFVDGALGPMISQRRAVERPPYIPTDLYTHLRDGWRVEQFEHTPAKTLVRLARELGESVEWEYDNAPEELAVLNARMEQFFIHSHGDLIITCLSCSRKNRIPGRTLKIAVKCGICGNALLPLRRNS
jgi:hypothetical protein